MKTRHSRYEQYLLPDCSTEDRLKALLIGARDFMNHDPSCSCSLVSELLWPDCDCGCEQLKERIDVVLRKCEKTQNPT